ncbi:hypothetical protein J6590_054085 [Homalodisca vitripennis]|nr:hypothetical protein J6590_054085 [Homalodisca vitripennis]
MDDSPEIQTTFVDSTPDVSHVNHLPFVIRQEKQREEPVERFLKLLLKVGHKAFDILKDVTEALQLLNWT